MSQLQFVGLSSAKASANAAADVNDKVTALFPEQDDEAVGTGLVYTSDAADDTPC